MGGTEEFYYGSGFGFDPTYGIGENYGESFLGIDYRFPAGQFGFPTDPTSANQLQAVSNKISTGAKTIEFSGLGISGGGGALSHLDQIPKQHLEEVRRLRKLTGIDLTFHGPLVEPTGARQGWQPHDREEVERHMIAAVRRAHELDPNGNIVVTFHASNGLPEPETKIVKEDGTTQIKEFWVINETGGNFQNVAEQVNYLKKDQKFDPHELIKRQNEEGWFRQLQNVNFHVHNGTGSIKESFLTRGEEDRKLLTEKEKNTLLEIYKKFAKGQEHEIIKELNPEQKEWVSKKMTQITHGDIYLRDAYLEFQNLFNTAYKNAEKYNRKEELNKLKDFREEISPKIKQIEEDPSKVEILGEELVKGINVLRSINAPQTLRPLREWAFEQASASFGNTAFDAYKQFKNSAPIISIENPPAGMGLSTADDLRKLVDDSREKFVKRAVDELKMSRDDAEEQAEKLIGVTWDVGHINMLRGKGYSEKHVIEQTGKIAPYVKHVHLSDNFGIEHTELPMGMGNVPTKQMLELIHKYNEKVKKIVETGSWYSRQGGLGQTQTPIRQTLSAFGSPVYGNMGPYWNQAVAITPGYFSGQGAINPDIHHSLYGSGFTNLPVEFGGQMAGRSRASGAPIE